MWHWFGIALTNVMKRTIAVRRQQNQDKKKATLVASFLLRIKDYEFVSELVPVLSARTLENAPLATTRYGWNG